MLACVSAIVVQQQPDIRTRRSAGVARVLGTFIGAVVAYVYLVNFRFSPAGMVVAVVLEEVICMMFKVPDNGKMATITLIIVLIVSERSPDLSPLANGLLLRCSEATVGAVVGIAAVWPVDRYRRWRQASAASLPEGVIREVAHTRQQVARRHPAFAGDLQFVDDDAAVGAGDREVGALVGLDGAGPLYYPRPVRNARRRFWPYRSAPLLEYRRPFWIGATVPARGSHAGRMDRSPQASASAPQECSPPLRCGRRSR